ncbi:MAG TPA: cytochrome c oxidase subunit 3 [Ignavibacteriaceae bacterium]|nr:cytochrome c oxidase subunit 3 [Ignavibacteriaceae bacterium]
MSTENQAVVHVHRDDVGARMGMWLFLLSEFLLFGGLFLMYSVYRFNHQHDFHVAAEGMNVFLGTANTLILLTSSLTMALAIAAMQKGNKILSLTLQIITFLFGVAFLVNKFFEWRAEFRAGNYPGSPILTAKPSGQILYYGLYYTMVGLHGVHVIVGMTIIAFMIRFTIKGIINKDNYVKLENAGLYWHLVDIIWIFLFPLFYLIT